MAAAVTIFAWSAGIGAVLGVLASLVAGFTWAVRLGRRIDLVVERADQVPALTEALTALKETLAALSGDSGPLGKVGRDVNKLWERHRGLDERVTVLEQRDAA